MIIESDQIQYLSPFMLISILVFNVLMVFCNLFIWYALYKKEKNVRTAFDHANKKALKLTEKASENAENIIIAAKYITEKAKSEIEKEIKEAMSLIKKDLSSKTAKELQNIIKTNNAEIEDFVNSLKEKSISANTELEDHIKISLNNALNDVENYKKQKVNEVEKNIDKLILNICKEFLSKNITLDEHKKLIFSSLERAKKEGVFDYD